MSSMYDKDLVIDIIKNIIWSLDQIQKRFKGITTSDDFIRDDSGLEKLDSICMQFINVGEALKQIDTLTQQTLLKNYGEIDWKSAKGMRDIITHHYFDIDAETVFTVCTDYIPTMEKILEKMLTEVIMLRD